LGDIIVEAIIPVVVDDIISGAAETGVVIIPGAVAIEFVIMPGIPAIELVIMPGSWAEPVDGLSPASAG